MVNKGQAEALFARIGIECNRDICLNVLEFLANRTSASAIQLSKYLSIEHRIKVYKNALQGVIEELVSKGVLQLITPKELDDIVLDFDKSGVLGPILGYPHDEDIDFTREGAHIWKEFLGYSSWGEEPCEIGVALAPHARLYFSSRYDALRVLIDDLPIHQRINACGPFRIGKWSDRWWRVFEQGFIAILHEETL